MIRNKRKSLIVKLCLTQGWDRIKKWEKKFLEEVIGPRFHSLARGGGVVNIICIISKNPIIFNYIPICYVIHVNIVRTLKYPVFSHFLALWSVEKWNTIKEIESGYSLSIPHKTPVSCRALLSRSCFILLQPIICPCFHRCILYYHVVITFTRNKC